MDGPTVDDLLAVEVEPPRMPSRRCTSTPPN